MITVNSKIHKQHIKIKEENDYRLIVISDIHGHLDEFKKLLKKVKYTVNDYLIILGDMVEKGTQSKELLHYIWDLKEINDKVIVLMGNCEWALYAMLTVPELSNQIHFYMNKIRYPSWVTSIYHELELDDGRETMLGEQLAMQEAIEKELKWIETLPTSLSFNNFLFVHAGIVEGVKKDNLNILLEMQQFYNKGHHSRSTVVVGHLPTSNYHANDIINDVIIDDQKKIICMDGGMGVKPICQLNALVIESTNQQVSYKTYSYIPYKYHKVIESVEGCNNEIYKVAFPYYKIEVLEKGEEFSKCKQVDTGYVFDIKNEFIHNDYCDDDYINRMLSVRKGQKVRLIEVYGKYAYVMKGKEVGWIPSNCID